MASCSFLAGPVFDISPFLYYEELVPFYGSNPRVQFSPMKTPRNRKVRRPNITTTTFFYVPTRQPELKGYVVQ